VWKQGVRKFNLLLLLTLALQPFVGFLFLRQVTPSFPIHLPPQTFLKGAIYVLYCHSKIFDILHTLKGSSAETVTF
jgi:hypothetical protein